MALPFIIGGLSAATSLIGDAIEAQQARKDKDNALNAWKKLLIPALETEKRKDMVGDTYYTKAMSELNSGAFAARGTLNPEVLKTIAYSKMAAGRAESELGVAEEDLKYNRGIRQQIAQTEATPTPKLNPMNAISAGVEGYFAGKQLQMGQQMVDAQKGYLEKLGNSLPGAAGNTVNWADANAIRTATPSTTDIKTPQLGTKNPLQFNPYISGVASTLKPKDDIAAGYFQPSSLNKVPDTMKPLDFGFKKVAAGSYQNKLFPDLKYKSTGSGTMPSEEESARKRFEKLLFGKHLNKIRGLE